MTAADLRTACENAQVNRRRLLGGDGLDGRIVLRLPGRWPKGGEYKRLAGRRGPKGRCVAEDVDKNGKPVVMVDFLAQDVLDFLGSAS